MDLACNIFVTSSFLLWTSSIPLPTGYLDTTIIRYLRNPDLSGRGVEDK